MEFSACCLFDPRTISTFGHFTISLFDLRIFRTNVISTFEIFVIGNFNSRTFRCMSLRHSHFTTFALFNPMLFWLFDISPKSIRPLGDVPMLFQFYVISTFALYTVSGWCLAYLRLFQTQTLTITISTTVWNKQDKRVLAQCGIRVSISDDGEKKDDSSASFDVRPGLFVW